MVFNYRLFTIYAQAMTARRILSRLRVGWRPSERELKGAPVLDQWRLFPLGPYVLQGRVGEQVISDVAVALDPGAGWARFADQWFVLGTPAPGPQAPFDNDDIMRSAELAFAGQYTNRHTIAAHARELAGRAREAGLTVPAYLLDLVAETAEEAR